MKMSNKKMFSSLLASAPLIILPITVSCTSTSSTTLDLEIDRLEGMDSQIKLEKPLITINEFRKIDDKFILMNVDELDLDTNTFEYDVRIVSKNEKSGEVKFNLKIAGVNNGQRANTRLADKMFVIDYNVIHNLSINDVLIKNSRESYNDGEEINLMSQVSVSTEFGANNLDDITNIKNELTYEWFLDGIKVFDQENYSFIAKFKDNGKKIKLKISYDNGKVWKESNELTLVIHKNSQQLVDDELARINGLNVSLNRPKPITKKQFDSIRGQDVIETFANDLGLNISNFEYQAIVVDRTFNQIKFKIKLANKNENIYQQSENEFTATFNVLPIIEKIEIAGLSSSFKNGETINLSANITMSNGFNAPQGDLTYEWLLDGQKVSDKKDYSFVANLEDNGKKLSLKATYAKGDSIEVLEIPLVIVKNDQQILEGEIARIKALHPSLNRLDPIAQSDFDLINEQYIINEFASELHLDQNKFDYGIVGLEKIKNKINFKINVSIKGANVPHLIENKFVATFNVLPIIEKVEIGGFNSSFKNGETINLSANITMSNGVQVPQEDLAYEWTLDGQIVSNQKDYSFVANFADNNKKIKLRVTYAKGKSEKITKELTLVIYENDQHMLDVELLRILKLNANINKLDQEILHSTFEGINEKYIIDNLGTDLALSKQRFDYQAEITGRTPNQIKFKIKVSIKGLNNFHLVDKEFVATFNIIPIISVVEIIGLKPSYIDGQEVNLSANITMSNGFNAPQEDLTYEWLLDGQKVSTKASYSFVANIANNNKKLKLRVTYAKGQSTTESIESTLVIHKNDQQILNDEKARIESLNPNIININLISKSQFDAINEQNILDIFEKELSLNRNNFDYQAIIVEKIPNFIKFKIKVRVKGVGEYHIVEKLFVGELNVQPYITNVIYSGLRIPAIYDYNEEIRLTIREITMSKGEVPKNIQFNWYLVSNKKLELIGSGENLVYRFDYADNNKELLLKASYGGNDKYTEPVHVNIVDMSLLAEEKKRIELLNPLINNVLIKQSQFDAINEQYILDNFETPLGLNRNIFDYQVSINKKTNNQVWFSLGLCIKGVGSFENVNNQFIASFNFTNSFPSIGQVLIKGIDKGTYLEGERINLSADVAILNGSSVPINATFRWFIDDKLVSTNREYSFITEYEKHSGKIFKLEVSYNGQKVFSIPESFNVKPSVDYEINRLIKNNEKIKTTPIDIPKFLFLEFNIHNYLESVYGREALGLRNDLFDYYTYTFTKNVHKGLVYVRIAVGEKGANKNEMKLIDYTFEIKYNFVRLYGLDSSNNQQPHSIDLLHKPKTFMKSIRQFFTVKNK